MQLRFLEARPVAEDAVPTAPAGNSVCSAPIANRRVATPVRHYRIGPVSVRLRCDVRDALHDFHRLYRRYESAFPLPDALDVRVEARRSRRSLRAYYYILADGEERFSVRSRNAVLPHIEWAVNCAVMDTLPRYYQIHAGVVARDGVGLILPAQPQSGKSTLVAGLLQRGWRYLSDEFALIDPSTLRLTAYPKAICIKRGSFHVVRRLGLTFAFDRDHNKGVKGRVRFIDPHSIRDDVVSGPVPVRLVIFPKYAGPGSPVLEPVSRARAVFELSRFSFTLTRFRSLAVDLLADVVENASCFRLQAADLGQSCDLIERCFQDAAGGANG